MASHISVAPGIVSLYLLSGVYITQNAIVMGGGDDSEKLKVKKQGNK